MRLFFQRYCSVYFFLSLVLVTVTRLACDFCKDNPQSEYCLEDITTSEGVRYKTYEESVRKVGEKILTEQPGNTDLINQHAVGMRGMPGKLTLLFMLLNVKFYDLANTVLDNKYFTQDSLDMTLINIAQAETEFWQTEEILNRITVLLDHGAKFAGTDIFSKDYANSQKLQLINNDQKIKKLLQEYEYFSKKPTKKLFFSMNGAPVAREKATFFVPKKQIIVSTHSKAYAELDSFALALKQITEG